MCTNEAGILRIFLYEVSLVSFRAMVEGSFILSLHLKSRFLYKEPAFYLARVGSKITAVIVLLNPVLCVMVNYFVVEDCGNYLTEFTQWESATGYPT